MKRHIPSVHTLLLLFVFFGIVLLSLCTKEQKEENKKLFTPDSLSTKDIEYLKERGFLENDEKTVCVYYHTTIKNEGVLLSDKKIVVYRKDTVENEMLENIFDLSSSHSDNPEIKSTITIYRKDDTEFSYSFPGGLDIDERFFSELRKLWRKVIAGNQARQVGPDSTDGVFLGVKKKGEQENKVSKEK